MRSATIIVRNGNDSSEMEMVNDTDIGCDNFIDHKIGTTLSLNVRRIWYIIIQHKRSLYLGTE